MIRPCPWRVLVCLCVLTSALTSIRCSDDDENDRAGTENCRPDAARVAALEACRDDDQCPCGTACYNGQCVAQCTKSSDCGRDARCDSFGRCRDEDDKETVAALSAETTGALSVTPPYLEAPGALETTVRVHAEGNPLSDLRVEASAGLEVKCDASAEFSATCVLPALTPASDALLALRTTSSIADNESRTLTIFGGAQTVSVTVVKSTPTIATQGSSLSGLLARAMQNMQKLTGTDSAKPAGRYTGRARIQDIGSRISRASNIPTAEVSGTAPSEDFDVAITADVFPISAPSADAGFYRIVLRDPTRTLLPTGELICTVKGRAPSGFYNVELPAQPWVVTTFESAAAPLGDNPEYQDVRARYRFAFKNDAGSVTVPDVADISTADLDSGRLRFAMLTHYDVSDRHQNAPKTRWDISLSYIGELPEDATAPAEPATTIADNPALPLARVLAPSLWESRVAASFAATDPRRVARTLLRQEADIGACNPGVSTEFQSYVAEHLYNTLWMKDSVTAGIAGLDDLPVLSSSRPNTLVTDATLHPMYADIAARLSSTFYGQVTKIGYTTQVYVPPGLTTLNSPLDPANPDLTVREVPCAYRAETGQINIGTSPPIFIPEATYDRCVETAAALGCDVRDTTSSERASAQFRTVHTFTQRITTDGEFGPDSFEWHNVDDFGASRTLIATKVCRMPVTPVACAELAVCHSGADTTTSSFAGADFHSSSGDALCASGGKTFGIAADQNPAGLTGVEMLAACLDDGAQLVAPPAAGAAISSTLATNGCTSLGGLLFGMGAASESVRETVVGPVSAARLNRASLLAQRLFVRFSDMYGFVARESVEAEKFAQVVRRESLAGAASLPSPEEALSVSLRVWGVLLSPRFQTAMQHLDANALVNPDYRSLFGGVSSSVPNGPRDPLAVALLRTSTAQLELAQVLIDRAGASRSAAVAQSAGEVLRYALVVEALAHDLVDRATLANGGSDTQWSGRYRASEAAFVTARGRLLANLEAMISGANPLGIGEADLPLYFTGGQISDDSRYFAISDYLIGSSAGSIDNWAPSLINDAAHKLEVARGAWLSRQSRNVINSRNEAERASRIGDVAALYGDRIVKLCGAPRGLATADILTKWQDAHGSDFDPDDCYLDLANSACTLDQDTYNAAVTTSTVQSAVALTQAINSVAPGQAKLNTPALTAAALACSPRDAGISGCNGGACFTCGSTSTAVLGAFASVLTDPSLDPSALRFATEQVKASGTVPAQVTPTETSLGSRPPASCYSGDIGEQQSALAAVAKDVDIARSTLDGFRSSYDIAMKTCIANKATADATAKEEAAAAHAEQMKSIETLKAVADSSAKAAQAAKECAALEAFNARLAAMPIKIGVPMVGCAPPVVQQETKTQSKDLSAVQAEIEAALAKHRAAFDGVLTRALPSTASQAAYDACQNDAQHYLVGVQAQALRIQRALLDVEAATVRFNNLKAEAQRAWNDGQAKLVAETSRTMTPLDSDLWLDEKVDGYIAAMRLAKRVTYLAVRAVEYEYQQSLAARERVLTAEVPKDLEDALRELRTYTAPRTVRGSKPTNKKAILSLRDAILRVFDQTGLSADNHRLTAVSRLRLALTSRRYAVFSPTGAYLGQQVPFTVSPAAFGSTSGGLELYAQDTCAEKLWSVNASVLGSGLLRGSSSTFTNLTVLKSNTFFSQWCDATERDTVLQVASVRPERNLFRDAIAGSPDFISQQLAGADSQFSKALIQPSLNVPRDELEDDAFANGDSSQLASRGLYGEYALFFPAQVLSQRRGATVSDGLDLTRIDDILLRFDYVTVAR